MPRYHIEMASYRRIGWITLVVWTAAAIAAFSAREPWAGAGFVALALASVCLLLAAGSYDLDDDGVTRRSVFGVWRIRWDEVTRAEIGRADRAIVLFGHDKRFPIDPPGTWPRPLRAEATAYLLRQLEQRQVPPPTFTPTAAYKTMRNTRVKRFE